MTVCQSVFLSRSMSVYLSPPKIENQMKEKAMGAVIVPLMNSLIVRPLEILAMNIPEGTS